MQVVAGPSGSGKSSLFPVAAADRGGHSASPSRVRATYAASVKNLPRALREFHVVTVYDNSRRGKPPVRVLEAAAGRVTFQVGRLPTWLRDLVRGSELA